MRTTLLHIALFCAILFPVILSGKDFHTFHLDQNDQLSNNFVRCIAQDRHGFVWVATIDGVNRFDGKRFHSFKKENSGLESNEINTVLADFSDPDKVWIGTRENGLFCYDYSSGLISKYSDNLSSQGITYLLPSADGNMWITYYDHPPEKLKTDSGEILPIYKDVPSDFKGKAWCMAEDGNKNTIYIGHDGRGMTQVNLGNKHFLNFQHSQYMETSIGGNHVYSILIDLKGNVWCGTENGLSIYSPDNNSFTNITHKDNHTLPSGVVKSMLKMTDNSIWIGTDKGGLCKIYPDRFIRGNYEFEPIISESASTKEGHLSSSYVSALFEDSYGNKWIGYRSYGLDVISYEAPFFILERPNFYSTNGEGNHSIWSLTTDKEGNIWMGGENHLIKKTLSGYSSFELPHKPEESTDICALYYDHNGLLWIGTFNSGAFVFNISTNMLKPIDIPQKEIRCFAETPEGEILIGTLNGVYISSGPDNICTVDQINRLITDKYVVSIAYDRHGNLWVGTYGHGVYIFDSNLKDITLHNKDIFPSNTINYLYEDSKDNMWVATRNGIVRISETDFSNLTIFNDLNGLLNNDIKGIVEDSAGNIWISSNAGIALLDTGNDSLTTYSYSYGKPLFSFCDGSVIKDHKNRIYFGSLNGLTHFNPSFASHKRHESQIILSSLLANDMNGEDHTHTVSIPVNNEKIELPYNFNSFTLSFCNPDITQAANSEYMYNMKGVNDVWTPVNNINEAVYHNLPPGNYEFQVCHRQNGEQWSQPQTLASIKILPPLYLRWWAKVLYGLAIIILIFIIAYFYKNKVDLEKSLALELETNRNNQLLNEERMVFFTNITHELRTPLSLIIGPIEDIVNDSNLKSEQRRKLLTIRTSSMRLLNLINSILEFRKTETNNKRMEVINDNFSNFIRAIGLRFKELNNNPKVNIVIDVSAMDGETIYYDPEIVTTILNNLLGNAIKFTHEGTVTLSLHSTVIGGVRYADMSVSDTGEGIDKETLPHIFERYFQAKHNRKVSGTGIGLALTKNLVELHEASIFVESQVNKGSKFTVRFIADNCYPNAIHKEVTTERDFLSKIEDDDSGTDKLKLLIVEDDPDIRDYVSHALENEFMIYCASNGKEGLDTVNKIMPDMIISDIMMPVMDGFELLERIKTEPATSHIPVILLTAKDSLTDKEKGYSSGADSYITKPFSINLLKARICNIIESRQILTARLLSLGSESSQNKSSDHEVSPSEEKKIENVLTPFDSEFIARFKNLTEENIENENLDIAFFTDKMCMSHSTLYRKVKSLTGLTPNEFVRKIKLHIAAELLSTGKVTLAEIPYRTGFNSATYFRRVFKKEFGVSPTEYIQGKTKESGPDT